MDHLTTLPLISKQIIMYCGMTIFIMGIIGGLLNIIIFTTLKTFRQTTCAFLLTITTIVNVITLPTTPVVFTLLQGFQIGLKNVSWFCKFHMFTSQWMIIISLISLCLATIDQFLSMSSYRHWSNLRIAQRAILIAILFGFIHSIFVLIYFDVQNGICLIVNPIYAQYLSLFEFPVLFGCLPIAILIIFSTITYIRARNIASRRMNIIRLQRDRQLTAMVLVHAVYKIITSLPYTIVFVYTTNKIETNPESIVIDDLITTVTLMITFSSFSVSFENCHYYESIVSFSIFLI